ncbi:MAG: FGGY family carbohydrate kinase [Parvibaculaceae bacterium]
MRILAVDQGTTSTRALVLTGSGAEVVHAAEHRQIFPAPGWVEHDPLELLANVRAAVEAAGSVDAIGLDNQGESCLAWHADTGEPLSPVIVWQDSRTQDRIGALKAEGSEALTKARAGLPLDPYFSASKLAWILETVPEAKALAAKGKLRLGTTDAFFLQHLTGHAATDAATASRTSLMDLKTGAWDEELCRLFRVPIEALPPIRPNVAHYGDTAHGPLTAAVVDQQAALYGHGCRAAGDAKITFGTGAFALALTGDKPVMDNPEGLVPTLAWRIGEDPAQYAVDGGVYNASSALDWARGLGLFGDFAEIENFEGPPAIERGLCFVPALSGLACPHWDRSADALWIGMSLDTPRSDLVRAVLEGVALRTTEVVAALDRTVGLGPSISIDGGLSRNRYFCRFLADTLGRTVSVATMPELTALGTAQLAALGAGLTPPSLESPAVVHEPSPVDRGARMQRFAAAVARARNWR